MAIFISDIPDVLGALLAKGNEEEFEDSELAAFFFIFKNIDGEYEVSTNGNSIYTADEAHIALLNALEDYAGKNKLPLLESKEHVLSLFEYLFWLLCDNAELFADGAEGLHEIWRRFRVKIFGWTAHKYGTEKAGELYGNMYLDELEEFDNE